MAEGKRTIHLMGTVIQMWVQAEQPEVLLAKAEAQLVDYEKRFSANNPNSHLMHINQQAGQQPVQVEADLLELIKIGKAQSMAKDSFLNIAIGPLIQTWRIGFQDAKRPTEKQIQTALSRINVADILIDDTQKTVYLKKAGMAIDLGALAKGYFADKIIAYFQMQGATAGFIDLGGNVLTFGESPNQADGYWRVGVQNPFLPRGNYLTVLKVKNQSVVTSGIYERKFEFAGKTYHHIFDSQTGYPITTDVASLTIVSEHSLAGEIWTTRLYGQKSTEMIRSVEKLPGIEGLVVTTAGLMAQTTNLQIVK
ncbi:thiamine biosynthesis lipoprotein [Enterococcus sp. PF1-24]|uniref:FAD:protein FMN transferase n=1 Tax=unclassified Enterococcus TaxID=2608891 RepID=UPI002475AD75|nr:MULTISPECIES: FAD:protein FMN transferase [unclassified Enterococcus]MDH6363895.1 thiamine biosynthesis lipoprotein [Enterococcus sp. PFB1-1]MDH6400919.1 thiamine biosynthesis lipoprotein [Enterococcus sp. PF1-24]